MNILVTRPEPEASAMKAQLEALGHEASIEPMLHIEPVAIEPHVLEGAQALIVTSRNGLRALAASGAMPAAHALPVFTVGPGTADLARELKFQRVIAGGGAARDLVPAITANADAAKGPLVHIAGEVIAFDIATALASEGFQVKSVTGYRAAPAAGLSAATTDSLANGAIDAVILMSPRSADTFAQLVAEARIDAHRLVLFCLSQAVADAAHRLSPARIEIAEEPNAAALLAMVGRVATPRREV